MDFFLKNFESAQATLAEQAKQAALNAQKTAKGFAEQVSKQGKVLAEQASSMSKEAAESAQHRLLSLDGPHLSLGTPKEPEKPSPAVLEKYGITPEFLDFVRSLTYSTFRDFPADELPAAKVLSCAVQLMTLGMFTCLSDNVAERSVARFQSTLDA